MKKYYILSMVLFTGLLISSVCKAQYYTGIGLRGGWYSSGLTVKHFFGTTNANGIEGMLTVKTSMGGGMLVHALYVHQSPFHSSTLHMPLHWIAGAGVQGGYFNSSNSRKVGAYAEYYPEDAIVIAVTAMLGLEYQFQSNPFTIGIDVKPFYDITYKNDEWMDMAVSVRYVFD